jgi:signal transduction histidine kinase
MRNRMSTESTGIQIESRYEVEEAWTLADGDRIKQVFWNFGENAIRAMQGGGLLRVTLEANGQDWQIGFADNGTGMTPQQTEKIFEPFQSNFEGGTGLGLAVVYQIVQAHEGKVWARSKAGQGTTFVLRLAQLGVERIREGQAQVETSPANGGDGQLTAAVGAGRRHG